MVTIFIPTYNSGAKLSKTLDSVINQNYRDIEIIVVDDDSNDGTRQILELYENLDKRLLVYHKKNEGTVPFSWNYAFPYMHGEWTFYMSHDDIIGPNCISQLVSCADKYKVDAVIPSCVGFENDYEKPEKKFHDFNKRSCVGKKEKIISGKKAFSLLLNYDIPGFALWRSSLIKKIGMPTEAYNSDEGMQRIWALNCKKIALCPEAIFYYRIVDNGITKGLKPYHYGDLITKRRIMLYIKEKKLYNVYSLRFYINYIRSMRYLKKQFALRLSEYTSEEQTIIKRALNIQ